MCVLVTGVQTCALPSAGEEVTFNATTGGEIFLLTDQFRDGAARLDRALVEIAPDRVGLIALPAILENIPGGELRVAIGGASVCLGDVEGNFPSAGRVEDRLAKTGQAWTPLPLPPQ